MTFMKLPFVVKTFVLSIFELLFYSGFTVVTSCTMWASSREFLASGIATWPGKHSAQLQRLARINKTLHVENLAIMLSRE